jgi:CheY-like chemotaxis protein
VNVLVVEDDEALAGAIASTLEEEGVGVTVARNGRAALEKLRGSFRPCLILLDITMPVMNGFEFRQEQLRDVSLAGIPVVVCTADGRLAQKALALGVAAFLKKPLTAAELLRVVRDYCPEFS